MNRKHSSPPCWALTGSYIENIRDTTDRRRSAFSGIPESRIGDRSARIQLSPQSLRFLQKRLTVLDTMMKQCKGASCPIDKCPVFDALYT